MTTSSKKSAAVCAGLLLLVWAVFGQTLRHDFFNYDDPAYVSDNAWIQSGLTVAGVSQILTRSHANLWHPLTTLSHMADCQIYGLRPGGHHLTNVLLHSAAALLLFLVLRNMTGQMWASAFVAAIFAIHPLRVESVAWIAERKDVLSAVFFMLTLGAYVRYAGRPTLPAYLLVALMLVCGLMSKATFTAVPAVLLLLDWWPLQRLTATTWPKVVAEKIPFGLLAIGAALATIAAQTVTMASLAQLSFGARLKNAIVTVAIYLRQMFWPVDLAPFYPHPHNQIGLGIALASGGLIFAITVGVVVVRKSHPYAVVGWLWYLLMLIPVLGFVQVGLQGHADRFTYLPHIGMTLALTWWVADWAGGVRAREVFSGVAGAVIVLGLAATSFHQARFWTDSITLWTHTLAVTSDNSLAHQDMAVALREAGRVEESVRHTRTAEIVRWQVAVKDYPEDPSLRDNLGVALIQDGDARGAIAQWQASLALNPNDGNALNNLAWVLATFPDDAVRDGKRAVELAEKAVQQPGGESPPVLRTLAAAYAESGRFDEAATTIERAIALPGADSLGRNLRQESELYRSRTPLRESPGRE